jgi:hypothetical protein
VASEGGITLNYLDKIPIPKIIEIANTLDEILDEINRKNKQGYK